MEGIKIKNCIKTVEGFQYSINIGFDLYDDEKIKAFIPTSASLELIEDIMLSTYSKSTDRARILVGAYGKGKSHIILMILSLLHRKDKHLFDGLLKYIKNYNIQLYDYINEYINSGKKILPVIVQGSSASLSQSLLTAVQKSLEINGLEKIMPDTHFQAAINTINNWENNYNDTFQRLLNILDEPIITFLAKLSDFEDSAYKKFELLYPTLTAGSIFNPFLGFDVLDIYASILKKIRLNGYNGLFIVYDEFSKYLESNITNADVIDIKLLQDFAEKANRSSDDQLHLLLISHKSISNYIDKLPKQRVDGWKAVSERFKHIEIKNNYTQSYELISKVIKHDKKIFDAYYHQNEPNFNRLMESINDDPSFEELSKEGKKNVIKDCYPLHPISTFILPRISEKIAQNERTLFTFLSSNNSNTLNKFIESVNLEFPLLTPDYIYDYFEPLFKKEPYTSDVYKLWHLTSNIINKIGEYSIGARITKAIALIYITDQFSKLPPTPDVLIKIFQESVDDISIIMDTINELQNKQYVIYMKKSNQYLKLKDTSGLNLGELIADRIERNKSSFDLRRVLNSTLYENFIYPTGYNDEKEVTRYFDLRFINSEDFFSVVNWEKRIEDENADGVIYAIIPKDEEEIRVISENFLKKKLISNRTVFVVPKKYTEIEKIAKEFQAITELKEEAIGDDLLIEEFNIYLEDLEKIIISYIDSYYKPEIKKSSYYFNSEEKNISRKANLSKLLSEICDSTFNLYPIINNESLNKDNPSAITINSRNKVISALLCNNIDANLGFAGYGQEIFIMRSSLINTGLLINEDTKPHLVLSGNNNYKIQNVIDIIVRFLRSTASSNSKNIGILYDELTKPDLGIGLKKGVIPIFITVVLHEFKQYIVITKNNRELEINVDLINNINMNPSDFDICLESWDENKNLYIKNLEKIFQNSIVEMEKEYNTFSYIAKAMHRWFISLPKFAKEAKSIYKSNGEKIELSMVNKKFINSLKGGEINSREFLFKKLPNIYDLKSVNEDLSNRIQLIKDALDNIINRLLEDLKLDVVTTFRKEQTTEASMTSIIKDWYGELEEPTKGHLFEGRENKILNQISIINNNEDAFIEIIAKELIGLRIEDWNDDTPEVFKAEIIKFKEKIEQENKEIKSSSGGNLLNSYKITFIDEEGKETNKTFNKASYNNISKLLSNDISASLEEYGEALSENEKRQVLIDILERYTH